MPESTAEIEAAYADHERSIGIKRIRMGCYIAMALLPAGFLVDVMVHKRELWTGLLVYRCLGSLAMLPLLLLVYTDFGTRRYRELGVLLAMIPVLCMAVIIRQIGEPASPYYAGFNLVLLAIGLVLQWNLAQSIASVGAVLAVYLGMWISDGTGHFEKYFNNFYFLLTTGVIVVIGSSVQSRLRFTEFVASYKLDESRQELERSYRRLQELDELKGRFFANVSHELRTPLTLLLAPLEALRNERLLPQDERVQEYLDIMQSNGLRLLKLINDLLELVRLEAGRVQLHKVPVDVDSFLRGLLKAIKRVTEDKGLQVHCHVDADLDEIVADPDKLEKIFLNLLFNAVKFTPAGGKLEVFAEPQDGMAVFEVRDTGVGIAEEHLEHVFARFWQVDTSSDRKYQGTGIGLALVRELTEAHGGSVDVESEVGVGTKFIVRLPLNPPAEAGAAPKPAAVTTPKVAAPAVETAGSTGADGWLPSLYRRAELFSGITPLRDAFRPWAPQGNLNRPKLLIADDDPDMLRFLRSQLGNDYQLAEASDGNQAVALAAQILPDIMICDMMIPEKDGLQVCKELREKTSTRSIPFLMLTARADEETKLRALAAGASDFLAKPFSSAELRVRLKNLVDAQQLQKALAWQNQKLEATLEQLKETELQLVQSEKMASLGRMSAGIIHEINNPLNFAKTGLFMLARQAKHLPESERADFEEILKDIEEGVTRVAGIVSELRSFSHPTGSTNEETDVSACMVVALRFLAAELSGKVVIRNEIPPGFTVRAQRNKLLQVLVNLMQNSLDALLTKPFPEGQKPEISLRAEVRGDVRVILIRDNGTGIPKVDLARIFDPFFTTKDVGKGTGLGLSICYRILNEAGGRITVQSEEGEYTEFALELPEQGRELDEVTDTVETA